MNISEIKRKFEGGQEIFRRPSVALLLARIEELEKSKSGKELSGGSIANVRMVCPGCYGFDGEHSSHCSLQTITNRGN